MPFLVYLIGDRLAAEFYSIDSTPARNDPRMPRNHAKIAAERYAAALKATHLQP